MTGPPRKRKDRVSAKHYLSFKDIKAKADVTIREVDCPEWGGTVFVRSMSGFEKDQFEASVMVKSGRDRDIDFHNMRAKMLVIVLCDKQGNRLEGLDSPDALTDLGKKNAIVLDRLFKIAQELSGYTQEEVDRLTKNSPGDQSGDSPTDSQ